MGRKKNKNKRPANPATAQPEQAKDDPNEPIDLGMVEAEPLANTEKQVDSTAVGIIDGSNGQTTAEHSPEETINQRTSAMYIEPDDETREAAKGTAVSDIAVDLSLGLPPANIETEKIETEQIDSDKVTNDEKRVPSDSDVNNQKRPLPTLEAEIPKGDTSEARELQEGVEVSNKDTKVHSFDPDNVMLEKPSFKPSLAGRFFGLVTCYSQRK